MNFVFFCSFWNYLKGISRMPQVTWFVTSRSHTGVLFLSIHKLLLWVLRPLLSPQKLFQNVQLSSQAAVVSTGCCWMNSNGHRTKTRPTPASDRRRPREVAMTSARRVCACAWRLWSRLLHRPEPLPASRTSALPPARFESTTGAFVSSSNLRECP